MTEKILYARIDEDYIKDITQWHWQLFHQVKQAREDAKSGILEYKEPQIREELYKFVFKTMGFKGILEVITVKENQFPIRELWDYEHEQKRSSTT